MTQKIRDEDRETEDDIARRELGPRGEPGAPDPAKMTPQREKKLPKSGKFDDAKQLMTHGGVLESEIVVRNLSSSVSNYVWRQLPVHDTMPPSRQSSS